MIKRIARKIRQKINALAEMVLIAAFAAFITFCIVTFFLGIYGWGILFWRQ